MVALEAEPAHPIRNPRRCCVQLLLPQWKQEDGGEINHRQCCEKRLVSKKRKNISHDLKDEVLGLAERKECSGILEASSTKTRDKSEKFRLPGGSDSGHRGQHGQTKSVPHCSVMVEVVEEQRYQRVKAPSPRQGSERSSACSWWDRLSSSTWLQVTRKTRSQPGVSLDCD